MKSETKSIAQVALIKLACQARIALIIAATVVTALVQADSAFAETTETVMPVLSEVEGWKLVTEQDPQSQLAQIRVVVRSGGLSDPESKSGLAHFTARAMLRGTKTRPYEDLIHAIESLGGSISVTVDPTQTVFYGTVRAENVDSYMDLIRDVLTQPAFDPKELVSLQGTIQGELKARLQDTRVLAARALLGKAYAGTSAALSAWGTVDAVSKFTPFDAREFFKARYVRENMIIGMTSPLSVDEMRKLISFKLDSVPTGALDFPKVPGHRIKGRRAVLVDRKGLSTTPFFVAVPGVADPDPEMLALEVANFVFGEDMTSRLMKVLRSDNGWTYGASSGFTQLFGPKSEPTLFSIYTYPSVEYAQVALEKSLTMLEEFALQGLTEEEFEAAREALSSNYAFMVDTAEKRLELKLRETSTGRPAHTPAEYRKELAALELAQVNAIIAKRILLQDMVISVVGDAELMQPLLGRLPLVESVELVDVQP